MNDTLKHKGWRRQMVNELREKGIADTRVLDAMAQVPRHLFLDTAMEHLAYSDRALPILCGQTISQPSTVAFQSELLDVQPEMKVLEIGTGSGYQTAVLCAMGAKVYTIERQKQLFDHTKALLTQLGYRPKCFLGDGYKGLQEVDYGPYDRVIITCGAPQVPHDVMQQLKIEGVMVIPVGNEEQEMRRIVKLGDNPDEWLVQRYGNCSFVPMLGKVEW